MQRDFSSRVYFAMPEYFYRDYSNDIDTNQLGNLVSNNTKRLINTGLPFLGLIKPLHQPLSLLFGVSRTITHLVNLKNAYVNNGNRLDLSLHSLELISVAISIASVALVIIAPPAAIVLTTLQDLTYAAINHRKHMDADDSNQAFESEMNIANGAYYLALIGRRTSDTTDHIILTIIALSGQIFAHSYRGKAELQKRNYIETSGHVLMALFRCIELKNQFYALS